MTLPKPPADPDGPSRNNSKDLLDDSINELDHLIKEVDTEHTTQQHIQIPVLEDIVESDVVNSQKQSHHTADDPELMNDQHASVNSITPHQLSELVDNIEVKLTEELDALVDLLKDTIKDNILDEIKTQLDAGFKKYDHDKKD